MKIFNIPRGMGIWSSLYLLLGIGLVIGAGSFWILNLIFSAFGIMSFTGAEMKMDGTDILFSFIPTITNGGRIGLFLSILGGLVSSAVEITLWVSPSENKKRGSETSIDKHNLFLWFGIIILIFDVLSTHFFLLGGTFINFSYGSSIGEKIINGLFSAIAVMGVTIILFSIGSELYLVYGIELIVVNYKEGFANLQKMIYTIFGVGNNENEYNHTVQENKHRPYEELERKRLEEEMNRRNSFNDIPKNNFQEKDYQKNDNQGNPNNGGKKKRGNPAWTKGMKSPRWKENRREETLVFGKDKE